ncbi:MAG: histidine triad nucleotide-binding protein [Pseudolysinimonas sp.]
MSEASVFERIVAGEIPASKVFENERVLAIRDIAPKAPVHLLVFPKVGTYPNVAALAAGDPALLAELVSVAQQLADENCNGEFRLIFNTGESVGQTVFHVHAHVLGDPEHTGALTEGTL